MKGTEVARGGEISAGLGADDRRRDDRDDNKERGGSAARGRVTRATLRKSGAREHEQIRGEDRGPHIGMKARRTFPHAPREAEDAFQERNPRLDPGAEAAEFVIHPLAPHHVEHGDAAPLREAHIGDSQALYSR